MNSVLNTIVDPPSFCREKYDLGSLGNFFDELGIVVGHDPYEEYHNDYFSGDQKYSGELLDKLIQWHSFLPIVLKKGTAHSSFVAMTRNLKEKVSLRHFAGQMACALYFSLHGFTVAYFIYELL